MTGVFHEKPGRIFVQKLFMCQFTYICPAQLNSCRDSSIIFMSIKFWNFQHSSIIYCLEIKTSLLQLFEMIWNTHYGLRIPLKSEVWILSQFFVT